MCILQNKQPMMRTDLHIFFFSERVQEEKEAYMVHEIHRRQQIEQFSGGILKRSRLAGEKENGGTGGLQICCRRNRTGACHAKYFFFQRISPKGDKRVFWRDDKPQNSCNLSEQHFRHLFDNQLSQLFPNSEAAMLSKCVK